MLTWPDYISNNPQFIVNGFLHTGISEALTDNDTPVPNSDDTESESDDDEEEDDDDDDDDDDDESNPVINYIVL